MSATDEELIQKAAKGDREALARLLEQHSAGLRQALTPKMPQRWRSLLEVEDVLQVTFMEAFRTIHEFASTDPSAFAAWLRRIAEHNLMDAIRELEAQKRPDVRKRMVAEGAADSYVDLFEQLAGTTTTPSRQVRKNERFDLLKEAIQKLPADYRKVIEGFDLEGREVDQIAVELGRSKGAVYMLRARAHDCLRDNLRSRIELTR